MMKHCAVAPPTEKIPDDNAKALELSCSTYTYASCLTCVWILAAVLLCVSPCLLLPELHNRAMTTRPRGLALSCSTSLTPAALHACGRIAVSLRIPACVAPAVGKAPEDPAMALKLFKSFFYITHMQQVRSM
jgi:hypothetical protein